MSTWVAQVCLLVDKCLACTDPEPLFQSPFHAVAISKLIQRDEGSAVMHGRRSLTDERLSIDD